MIGKATVPEPHAQMPNIPLRRVASWRDFILDGLDLDRYASRSEAAAASACGYLNAGATFADWHDAMTTTGAALNWATHRKTGKRRPAADTDKRLRDTWRKAERFTQSRPPVGDKASARWEIAQARSRADLAPWGGHAGTTNRLVIAALHDLADTHGRLQIAASVRDVAESAGVSAAAAARALKRLCLEGVWLRREFAPTRTEATEYRLLVPAPTAAIAAFDSRSDRTSPQPHTLARHDAFAWAGLGRSAARIYAALGDEGRTVAQIAAALGLSQRTVRRHLAALSDYDLGTYSRLSATWARVERDADSEAEHLDTLAEALGTAGTAARRSTAHKRQREAWAMVVQLRGEVWAHRAPPDSERQRKSHNGARIAA